MAVGARGADQQDRPCGVRAARLGDVFAHRRREVAAGHDQRVRAVAVRARLGGQVDELGHVQLAAEGDERLDHAAVDAVVEHHECFHGPGHRAPPVSRDDAVTLLAAGDVALAARSTSHTLPLSAAKASAPACVSLTFSVTLLCWFCWLPEPRPPLPLEVGAFRTGALAISRWTTGWLRGCVSRSAQTSTWSPS